MLKYVKKMFDFSIDEKEEEKLEVKEAKQTKEIRENREVLKEQRAKKAQVINFEEKRVRVEQEDNTNYNIVVFKPYDYQDCSKIADWIAKDIIVILNLEDVETQLGQRVLDFIFGAIYIKNAELKKIAKKVYICIPPNMKLKIDDLDYSETKSYNNEEEEMSAEEIKPKYMNV